MAITHRSASAAQSSIAGASILGTSYGQNVLAHSLLVVGCVGNGTTQFNEPGDTLGTNWYTVATRYASAPAIALFAGFAPSGGANDVTVSRNASGNIDVAILEFTSLADLGLADLVDQTITGNTNPAGSSLTATTAATLMPYELAIAWWGSGQTTSGITVAQPSSPWTVVEHQEQGVASASCYSSIAFQILSASASSPSATWSLTGGTLTQSAIIATLVADPFPLTYGMPPPIQNPVYRT